MTIARTWLLLGAGALLVTSTEATAQNRAQGSGIRISKDNSAPTAVSTTPSTTTALETTTSTGNVVINSTAFSLSSYANMTEANMLAHLLS
ncbi:MAG TPA: hypothetical protein VKH19_02880, partial [Gemmatimonadaceae bacterium]|nr:hypothetical protein [Gemmatimonadaceae bacterium]